MTTSGSQVLPDVGVESEFVEFIPDTRAVRFRYRLIDGTGGDAFPAGDWLEVSISVQTFDPDAARRADVSSPRAMGPEVSATARTHWSVVDLPIPVVAVGEHAFAAKVFSADDRYRKPFSPSKCWVYRATFGEYQRIDLQTLRDAYAGSTGNPLAEEEIRSEVREGHVAAVDEHGVLFRAREQDGRLVVEPLPKA